MVEDMPERMREGSGPTDTGAMAITVESSSPTTDGSDPGHYGVIVIGAGPAGVSAALRAARLGASVAVVEGSRVGGTCVNTGCMPTRVLARAARLLRDVRSAGDFGVHVPRPDLAWERTAARVRTTVEQVQGAKDIGGQLDAAGVHLITEGLGPLQGSAHRRAQWFRAAAHR